MSQSRKQRRAKKPKDLETEAASVTTREQTGKRTGYIIASLVVAVVLIILGIGYYQNYVAPFQRIIVTVDDVEINMNYFLKRSKLSGLDAFSV